MKYLPPEDRQEWILDTFAEWIQKCGYESFVSAPILIPTSDYFPMTWSYETDDIGSLLSRIMSYAGLSRFDILLQLYRTHSLIDWTQEGRPFESWHEGAAGWFAGVKGNRFLFGVDVEQVSEPEELIAVLCHEVAHAYRQHHKLEHDDRQEDEEQTDLTTVFLGMGIFTTNCSLQFRSGSLGGSSLDGHMWSHRTVGYLSPKAFSFAMAVQWVVRGLSKAEQQKLLAFLETNQRSYVLSACKYLAPKRTELLKRLALPHQDEWPDVLDIEDWVDDARQIDVFILPEPSKGAEESQISIDPAQTTHTPIFRVPEHAGHYVAFFIGLIGFFVLGLAAGGTPLPSFSGAALGIVFGFWLGKRLTYREACSDPSCEVSLPQHLQHCPGCGGFIAGKIKNRNHRLTAEEEWFAKQRENSSNSSRNMS